MWFPLTRRMVTSRYRAMLVYFICRDILVYANVVAQYFYQAYAGEEDEELLVYFVHSYVTLQTRY